MDKRKEIDGIDTKTIDIIELITQLRNERLLVLSELKAIKAANEKVREITDKLTRAAWLNLQKRIVLNTLAIANSKAITVKCWQNLNMLSNTVFVHSKEILTYHESQKFGELLQILRSKPETLAHLLVAGGNENSVLEDGNCIINCLTSGLYGALLLPEDVSLILSLLQHLAKLELVTADNPRRRLRHKSCAFSQLYFLFHENLPAAKLFLITALRKPIMYLIAKTDEYLDVDPEKSVNRFIQKENGHKFVANAAENEIESNIHLYRRNIVDKLVQFSTYFITSIRDSIVCFPGSFAWLIGQVSDMMAKTYGLNSKEVHEVNTDLIFTLFICPAIIHPEAYGICDVSICEVTRHNLMQVAQILQTLALFKFQDTEPKNIDFYRLFERNAVYNIIDDLKNSINENDLSVDHIPEVHRTTVLFTVEELYSLVSYLQKALNTINLENENQSDEIDKNPFQCKKKLNSIPSLKQISSLLNSLVTLQVEQSNIQGKLAHSVNSAANFNSSAGTNGKIGKVHKSKRSNSPNGSGKFKPETVLIIPIQQDKIQHIGLLPEHKVIGIEADDIGEEYSQSNIDEEDHSPPPAGAPSGGINSVVGHEKRIRFSRSHDESSVGNTSDNLEAVSEAASNHSVDSSVELENEDQNDNLSDMISANVSGRGTPNISGRDTPSSQVNDVDEGVHEEAVIEAPEPPLPPNRTQIINKQAQSEIDDKFCKFEIKKMLEGEETRSIISDTWSTDVLASDNETVDGNDIRGEQQTIHFVMEGQLMGPPGGGPPLLDMSETKSESGWSTDVLASDSERLTEVDADDVSVARLDDAVSVARSDDVAATSAETIAISNIGTSEESFKAEQVEILKMDGLELPCCLTSESSNSINPAICSCQRCKLEYSVGNANTISSSSEYEAINNLLQINEISNRQNVSNSSRRTLKDQDLDSIQNLGSNIEYNSSTSSSSSLESHTKDSQKFEKPDDEKRDNVLRSTMISFTPLSVSSGTSLSYAAAAIKNVSGSGGSALKSTSLNGAIPKSISFDVSAEKGSDDEQKEKRGGFLGKLKMGFRSRRGKSLRDAEELQQNPNEKLTPTLRRSASEESPNFTFTGMCDDILAKYRKTVCDNNSITKGKATNLKLSKTDQKQEESLLYQEEVDNNLTFSNVKRKLRLVLSNSCGYHSTIRKTGSKHVKSDLESYLQLELAKAHKLKYWSSARIAEVLHCVRMFDEENCLKLCTILKEDYCQRSVYIQYLIQSRQLLLSILAFLDGLSEQIESERELSTLYMATICVRLFLEKHELQMQRFCKEFAQLTLVDEKCYLLKEFLNSLYSLIRKDTIWQDKMELAEVAIERAVINEVYYNALYPNGDGDKDRDSVLREHLQKLSKVISPNHKDLMINKHFQHECPWLPAQEALKEMASYRTPRDKVACVMRCTIAIKDLLSLASSRIPTADDFTPILVYVIIKANPPNLLSTIQYVNSFYGDWLQGEDSYWWTQFCAAVEFTKTMDYCD